MGYLKYLWVLVLMCLIGLIMLGIGGKDFDYTYEMIMPVRYDTVWADLTTYDRVPVWYPGVKSTAIDSGEVDSAPSKYKWTITGENGEEISYPVTIVERDRLKSITYVHSMSGANKKVKWTIEQLAGMDTRVTGYYEWEPKGFFNKIIYPFNSLSLSYEDQRVLEELREYYRELQSAGSKK